jgi:TonB-dependent receptor
MNPASPPSAPSVFARLAALAAAFLLLVVAAAAQTGGVLSGVVTNPRGEFVTGAEVRLLGVGVTTTDDAGRFRFGNVPAGPQQVSVSYLGFEPYAATVEVTGETTLTIKLTSDVVVLDKFVVESFAEGQARAVNRQRSSDTIQNIVASDRLGRLPDASIGEALSRLPGIGLQTDRGEAEYITIRGAAAKFNNVALNGDRLPAPFSPVATDIGDVRAVSLKQIPTDLIASIEVTKAITPDMDADSVGGAVNLKTRSSLDVQRRVISGRLQYGWNEMDSQKQYAGNFTYADRFGKNSDYGFQVSGSYQYNNRPVQAVNAEYRTGTVGGVTYDTLLDQIDLRHRITDRKRLGANAQFDFRTGPNAQHYVRAFVNEFSDREERRRFRVRFGSGGTYLAGSSNTAGVIDGGRLEHQDRKSRSRTLTTSLGAGGEFNFPRFDLDYSFSTSEGEFTLDRQETTWENRRPTGGGVVDYTYDRTDANFPRFTDPLNSVNDKASFILASNRGTHLIRDDDATDSDKTGALNLRFPATLGGAQGFWKFGTRLRSKDRDQRPDATNYNPVASATQSLANYLGDVFPDIRGTYRYGPTTNYDTLRAFFAANLSSFTINQNTFLTTNLPGTYQASEDIWSGYGMGSFEFGRTRVVAGLRWENTDNSYNGHVVTTGAGGVVTGVTRIERSSSYDNFFPAVVVTHRFTDRLLLRGAWTNSIARPDYGDLVPRRTINDANNTIDEGNPAIKPLESANFDLSLEWYLPSAGLISVGLFHKELSDFRFVQTSTIVFDAGLGPENFTLRRPENGPSGSFSGIELNWQQRFKFLPAPFDGLGITANYARIEGEAEIPGRGTMDRVPDQLDQVWNLILDYEKGRFTARVAYNYNGVAQQTFAGAPLDDQFIDEEESFDASVSYSFRRGWQLFVEGKNLTDTRKRRLYLGHSSRPIEQEYTGLSIIAGIKFDL